MFFLVVRSFKIVSEQLSNKQSSVELTLTIVPMPYVVSPELTYYFMTGNLLTPFAHLAHPWQAPVLSLYL